MEREEKHLVQILRGNGYPDHIISSASRLKKRNEHEEEPPKHTLCLPYVSGVSEDLRRVCRKYNIRTVFTTVSTLRQQLTRVKDIDPDLGRAGVVYKIPCECGQDYIGETKRVLRTRLKEHQAATRQGETDKSAIAEHAWTYQHRPLWDKISVVDEARKNNLLQIKEAFHILLTEQKRLINKDHGTSIAGCWMSLLRSKLSVHSCLSIQNAAVQTNPSGVT